MNSNGKIKIDFHDVFNNIESIRALIVIALNEVIEKTLKSLETYFALFRLKTLKHDKRIDK